MSGKKKTRYISLRPGDRIPEEPPGRTLLKNGHVRLWWRVAPYTVAITEEHRIELDGTITFARETRWRDGNRSNNHPDNLIRLYDVVGRSPIRRLRRGEKIPAGLPRRYPHKSNGYVRLRWTVAPGQEVEVYEHRVVGGYVTTAPQVHHKNRDRADNSPENLEPKESSIEHMAEHRTADDLRVKELYLAGANTVEVSKLTGYNTGNVWRILKRQGVEMRNDPPINKVRLNPEEVKAMFDQGMRPEAIGKQFGVSHTPIRRILKELGVVSHRPGRPMESKIPDISS